MARGPFVRDDKVLRGRGEWLFLGDDTNSVVAQHTGELRLSGEQLRAWRDLLEGRLGTLAQSHIPYLFMVVPDTHAVYPEQLPEAVRPAAERPIHQLLDSLGDAGSPAHVLYPLEELLRAKRDRLVYSRYDTHWTGHGAFVGYDVLANEIEADVPIRRIRADELVSYDAPFVGDLSFKVDPEWRPVQPHVYLPLQARLVHDSCIAGPGREVVTECAAAPSSTCFVFGDSYVYSLLPYLGESFRRVVFAHTVRFEPELVERERPDVVLNVMAERFLIRVPDDVNGRSFDDFATRKRANGRLWPRMPDWDDPESRDPRRAR